MTYAVELLNITKDFPGIRANDNVTVRLKEGTIHALLGENGAGKSTLMSILFGLYQPTSGHIKVNGQEVKINDPNDATALGIGMVHQHFKLIECFTVTENIILGMEPTKYGMVDVKRAAKEIAELSKKFECRSVCEDIRYYCRHAAACGNFEDALPQCEYFDFR